MFKQSVTLFCIILASLLDASAQDFGSHFTDKTLRIDYHFSGDAHQQVIALDKLSCLPGWHGKRRRLSEVPVQGNGQITVRDHASGAVRYRNSFSTLFQEWLSYDEARTHRRSFENVFLVPMPQKIVDVTIELRNNRHEVIAQMTHVVDPSDILIRHIGTHHVTPHKTIQRANDAEHCIHIAYIAEGYTESEMDDFLNDVHTANAAIFAHEPFKSSRDCFNIVAVMPASRESGTSEPSKGIWKSTALGSHFDTFYSSRYLTTLNLKTMHDHLAGIPYEHIIVLVNTSQYGGGGILNSYNLSMTKHPSFKPVVAHEFGHSFAGLADEYAYEHESIPMYPNDVEPWEPNITTLVNFKSKWEDLIRKKTPIPTPPSKNPKDETTRVGVFEGAGYSTKGVYRPTQDCRMRSNNNPEFCPVCKRAITRLIDFYTK